jgi:hypothetical protein
MAVDDFQPGEAHRGSTGDQNAVRGDKLSRFGRGRQRTSADVVEQPVCGALQGGEGRQIVGPSRPHATSPVPANAGHGLDRATTTVRVANGYRQWRPNPTEQ